MTDQTPRTEAGRAYVDDVARDELRLWWESLTYEDKWEAFLIEKSNAEAAAQARTEALDVEVLAKVRRGLEVLHSPHFDWGCNPQNCSGIEALEIIDAAILAAKADR